MGTPEGESEEDGAGAVEVRMIGPVLDIDGLESESRHLTLRKVH